MLVSGEMELDTERRRVLEIRLEQALREATATPETPDRRTPDFTTPDFATPELVPPAGEGAAEVGEMALGPGPEPELVANEHWLEHRGVLRLVVAVVRVVVDEHVSRVDLVANQLDEVVEHQRVAVGHER